MSAIPENFFQEPRDIEIPAPEITEDGGPKPTDLQGSFLGMKIIFYYITLRGKTILETIR